jgi:SAM-dependent methyltransferase
MGDFLAIQTQTGWGRVLELFADWCAAQPGWLTLDAGCGPGLLPALLRREGCRAYGIDLDPAALRPGRLHPELAQADALLPPFPPETFHLVTASNLLFLLAEPLPVLRSLASLVRPEGQVCLLNPSEKLSVAAASALAEQRGLEGLARDSLLNWAARAETNQRWSQAGLEDLFAEAGLTMLEATLKVGPGLAQFGRGVKSR